MSARERALTRLAEEQKWIDEHGGNLSAYIERYGSETDPDHYGNGAEQIFSADMAALARAEDEALAEMVKAREKSR